MDESINNNMDLSEEWDYEKNYPYTLNNVEPHSNRSFYWKCLQGHPSYLCTIDKRRKEHRGCPVCSNHKVIAGINDIFTRRSDLRSFWSDTNTIDPLTVSDRSTRIAKWFCNKCGASWEGRIRDIADRTYTCRKCGYAERSNQRRINLTAAHGSLSDEILLLDWDYESNDPLTPNDVTPRSNKKVYWKCHVCQYKWCASISNRSKGTGCPNCSNKVVISGINDLATTDPEIAKEWYQPDNGDLTPDCVSRGSGKKVVWKCPRGHIYYASILHRTNGRTKCPVCNSGRQTSFSEQAVLYYVQKYYPNAINRYKQVFSNGMELDIFIPEINTGIEYDGVYWHNKNGSLNREKRKYDICREHGIKLIRIREENENENVSSVCDWCIFFPDNKAEFDSLDYVIKELLIHLKHEAKNEQEKTGDQFRVDADIDVNRDRFDILSYLTGPVKDSLADVVPELLEDWDNSRNGELKPDMITAGSSLSVHWICHKCGYHWETTVSSRAISHTRCPHCLGLVLVEGENDLATRNPGLLKDWDYEENAKEKLDPKKIKNNSTKKVHWICADCGYKWIASVYSRSVDGCGCLQCGYKNSQIQKTKNRIEKQGSLADSELIKEWDYEKNSAIGLDPKFVSPGSNKSAFWICSTCGYRWEAPIARRSKGAGCRKCADKLIPALLLKSRIKQGRGIADPVLLKEWDYSKNEKRPDEYSYGSGVKVNWICSVCGYSWMASINSRHKGAGCPACAGNIMVSGKNDILTVRPDLEKEWDYSKNGADLPQFVAVSSNKKYWWICLMGHESFLASPGHRIRGTGCPVCGRIKISESRSKSQNETTVTVRKKE